MAKLVWLGEPTLEDEGPNKNVWNNITFKRGEEVEIDDERMIAKARKMPSYSVDGEVYVPDGAQPHPNAGAGPIRRDLTELSEMNVAELREEADRRGLDHEGMNKTELRELLANN